MTVDELHEVEKPRKRTENIDIEIPAAGNEANDVTLKVVARDYAGNSSEKERTLSIDTKAPEISIDFDGSGVRNGKYFNSTRTVKVSFTERNYSAG